MGLAAGLGGLGPGFGGYHEDGSGIGWWFYDLVSLKWLRLVGSCKWWRVGLVRIEMPYCEKLARRESGSEN